MQTLHNRENTLRVIENYLAHTKMDAAQFSKNVSGNPQLVAALRDGQEMKQSVYTRIHKYIERAYMESDDDGKLAEIALKTHVLAMARLMPSLTENIQEALRLIRTGDQLATLGTLFALSKPLKDLAALQAAALIITAKEI